MRNILHRQALIGVGIVLLGIAVPLLAARPQSGGQTAADATGIYKLINVDGRELPTTVSHDGQSGPTVTTGSITLNKDATFVASFTFLAPNGQTITNERKGTYNREGANLDLTWEGAGHTKATVDASTLTMNNEGILWKFRK